MGQPSTSAQIRAVALKEAVASMPKFELPGMFVSQKLDDQADQILDRAEKFASYIENGKEVDPNA
jgi:hypothetical protein